MKQARKRGRPSKAAAAAAQLGSWDRSAEKPAAPKSKRGRPSARTVAARLLAAKRVAAQTPEQRSAIASAGGKAAPNPNPPKPSTCPHCSEAIPTARAARKHPAQCRALWLQRIQKRQAGRR